MEKQGNCSRQPALTEDVLWLKIFHLGDRILCPGLQLLAYRRMMATFTTSEPNIPSREFITLLYAKESASPLALQMYVVEHVTYWLPKSQNKEDWGQLFSINERFGMEMALAMVRSQSKAPGFVHPIDQPRFAQNHGLDLPELIAQAKSSDEPCPAGSTKRLQQATLSEYSHALAVQYRLTDTVL